MDQGAGEVIPVLVSAGQRKVLNVPYASQLGPGADAHNDDCGAASIAMLINAYTGATIPVDTLFFECQPAGDVPLSAGQLMTVLEKHGVKTKWFAFQKEGDLYTFISSRRPFIALILYGVLVQAGFTERMDFKGFHFVVVVGADVGTVVIHDPYYSGGGGKNVEIPLELFMRAWKEAGADPQANPANGAIVPVAALTERIVVTPPPAGGDVPGGSRPMSGTKYQVIASDGLNIRTGPGVNFAKDGKFNQGAEIMVERIDGDWAKLVGVERYVFAAWIVKV
jgi:hypothetical protein